MLTSGKVKEDVVSMYPELDDLTLPIQLEMFKQTHKAESLHEAKVSYRSSTDSTETSSGVSSFVMRM